MIDQPLATRAPEGTLRSVFVLRGRRYDMDALSLVGAELDAAVTPRA